MTDLEHPLSDIKETINKSINVFWGVLSSACRNQFLVRVIKLTNEPLIKRERMERIFQSHPLIMGEKIFKFAINQFELGTITSSFSKMNC